jgi:hypothetical protein
MAIPRSPVLILLLALGACGDTPAGEALRGVRTAPATEAPPDGPSLQLMAPRRAVLTPVSGAGQRRLWRGDGGIAVATEGARVVATAGFAQMVMGTRVEGPDPLDDPRALAGREATARRTVDVAGNDRDPSSMRFGIVLDCRLQGTAQGEWILVEERCPLASGAVVNRFWADAESGTVWRSEQWAGEGVTLSIEMRGL